MMVTDPVMILTPEAVYIHEAPKGPVQISALAAIEYIRERYVLKPDVQQGDWALPVGTVDAPIKAWYCASTHLSPQPGGLRHYGIDLNWEKSPRGDVDFGQPIWAVTSGKVYQRGHSAGWLCVLVIKHQYVNSIGKSRVFYMRYAHLGETFANVGDYVVPGQMIGRIGDYVSGRGGDHLHLDAALTPFDWNWYRTKGVTWINPIVLFKKHIDEDVVDSMVRDDKTY